MMMPSSSYRIVALPGALLVLSLALLPDLITSQCDNVIIEEPDPVLDEPLGTQVKLNCRVDMNYMTAWTITLPGSPSATTNRNVTVAFLARNHSIMTEVSSAVNREPPLRIIGTIGNSGTTVQCIAIGVFDCPGTIVQITFHGPPLAPENLTVTANGLGSLQITWSLDNADNVSVDFVVNATNVANPSERIVMRTSKLISAISFSDNTSCNNYSIQVVANNSAGQGPPSDVIIRSVPSLPEIAAVEESLQHTLRKTSNGITLDVTLNDVTACPEYPVHNYTLVVEDSEGNGATQTSQATGDIVNVSISGLMENVCYSYHVLATNQFGHSKPSAAVVVFATDNTTNVSSVMEACPGTTTRPTTASASLDPGSAGGISFGLIVGLALGLVLIVAVIIVVAGIACRKKGPRRTFHVDHSEGFKNKGAVSIKLEEGIYSLPADDVSGGTLKVPTWNNHKQGGSPYSKRGSRPSIPPSPQLQQEDTYSQLVVPSIPEYHCTHTDGRV